MNCKECQELLDSYHDLPEYSIEKQEIKEHLQECSVCYEQWNMWEKSSHFLKEMNDEDPILEREVSKRVMDRIYEQESWRIPVPNRVYHFSYAVKRNLMAVISFFVVLFMFSFIYSLIQKGGVWLYQLTNPLSDFNQWPVLLETMQTLLQARYLMVLLV